jgi:hypothetical protein
VKILDNEGKEVSRIAVIGRYFRLPNEGTKEFMEGCKALTEADKDELAVGAAPLLGLQVVQ